MGRGKALGRKKTRPTRSPKVKPTRVTVASPSGREGRTISVSSRSILARGRTPRLVSVKTRTRTRPTRVTVASPSGREGRTISVSSRSILARGRKSPPSRPTRRPTFASDLIPFQSQSRPPTKRPLIFETFTPPKRRRTGRDRAEERQERAPSFVPRGRRRGIEEEGSDFDVLNFFA